VFSKPVYNLRGMGIGSRAIETAADYRDSMTPGHFWTQLLQGEHVSTDVALVDGSPRWWRHATGQPSGEGTFDHWRVHAEAKSEVESWCGDWAARHLKGYTGMANFETIGARIIEMHLRFADQWPDLYGAGWVEALINLYSAGEWHFADTGRRDGFSVVLFGQHGRHYRHPPPDLVARVREHPGVSSVQITFHEDKEPGLHAMPPGGFRLAIINCWSLESGAAARDLLRAAFLAE